jgi:hypothetical protein
VFVTEWNPLTKDLDLPRVLQEHLPELTIYTRAKAKATTAGDRRQAVALQRQFRESNKVDAQDDQGKVKTTKSGRTRKTLHDNLKF